jgi:hypothetical protein
MTYTEELAPPASPEPTPWETCDHCQAPLDDRQRYCVACGARRAHSDDPVARYFVTSARRARATTTAPPAAAAQRPTQGLKLAIILALIPVAAAIGVVAGRGSTNDDDLLLQALKAQKAPVVNVTGGGAAADDTASAKDGDGKAKNAKKDDNPNDADGKVIAKTEYGSARQLTGSKVTEAQKAESKKALDHIVNSKGKEYVEQQRNLPDQIVIP